MSENQKSKSDKAAAIMGKMLLKGFRMTAFNCEVCNGIIMQDKEGRDICVVCDQKDEADVRQGGDTIPPGMEEQAAPKSASCNTLATLKAKMTTGKEAPEIADIVHNLLREIKIVTSSLNLIDNSPASISEKEKSIHYCKQCVNLINQLRIIYPQESQ